MTTLSVLFVITLAFLNAKIDSKLILKEKYISEEEHYLRAMIRLIVISRITLLCVNNYWIDYVFVLLINFSVFWIAFDVFINFNLNLPLFRIGETAWTDKMLEKISNGSNEMAFIFKSAIFFIFVFGYIEYLNYFA